MSARPRPIRRPPSERVAAWLVTGPLGHLVAFVSDVVVLWARWAAAGGRSRLSAVARSGR